MINEHQMTLGTNYSGQDVTGWFASEKLDGCRAYWDGHHLWTRSGNIIKAPEWFTKDLPKHMHLDGEIWAGRGQFETAKVAVQFSRFGDELNCPVQFVVFDAIIPDWLFGAPSGLGDWYSRVRKASSEIQGVKFATTVELLGVVKDRKHLAEMFNSIKKLGGEGIVLRNPEIKTYEVGRSKNFLKLKNSITI